MNMMDFLVWYYTKGILYYLDGWRDSIEGVLHYFSLGLLVKTLFDPWKRLIEVDSGAGFDFQKKFEVFSFNMVSRGVGFVVRIILFLTGLIFVAGVLVGGASGLVLWLVFPFFGVGLWRRYMNQPKNYVENLLFKIKSSKENPLGIILTSSAGSFFCKRLGLSDDDLIKNGRWNLLDTDKLNAGSFSDLIRSLLESGVWSEEFISSRGLKHDDFLYASWWWDWLQSERTKIGKKELGRPGIALELTFGYTPTLDKYSVDLGKPLPYSHRLIGRQAIVSRMERVLSSGNSVFLVGQVGVGKKTVVLEFAKRAISGNLGKNMAYKRVLEFDYNKLLSQATDINSKKRDLDYCLTEASYAGNIILMIRDLYRLTNSEVEGYDFTDVFEKHLEGRNLKIISISNVDDYERYLARNLRLGKFFEKIEVVPPSKSDAMLILIEAANLWEDRTGYVILIPALRNILERSEDYITEVPFPEKAIELLDAVVTYKGQVGGTVVTLDDTNAIFEEKTGVPLRSLSGDEKDRLSSIEDLMHKRLVGQDIALSMIAKTLRAKSVGVVKEKRPLGSFLFLGPTGVGKTETAKVLARVYFGSEDSMIRFDMAEYSGSEGLERLIGSVSKGLPGVLTTAIKNRPASLLLLDEIEKANKDIYNLFLALLDEGVITDAFGKKIVCKNLFVVATSNAGAEFVRQLVQGGVRGDDLQNQTVNWVLEKGIFSPEFLNRFDGVVVYEPLNRDDMLKIARLMLDDLKSNLEEKNIFLEFTEDTYRKLAEDGFDPAFGARPMKRIVNISIGDTIGKAILDGTVKEGDKILLLPGDKKSEFIISKYH
jgi:ATP-dependent Clp protease ATP-binding subunit ClpC